MKKLLLLTTVFLFYVAAIAQTNVGIGTNNPQTKLQVAGAISSTPASATAAGTVVIPDNLTTFRLAAGSGPSSLSVANPQDGQFLNIQNDDAHAATFATFTIPAGGMGSFLYLAVDGAWKQMANNNSGSNAFTAGTGLGWSGTTLNSVWTQTGSNISNNNAGNVGIGTTTAAWPFVVRSAGTATNTIMASLANAAGSMDANFELVTARGVTTDNNSGDVTNQIGLNYAGGTTLNAMVRFHRGGSTTGGFMSFTTNNNTEAMRIDASQNVGIGTTGATAQLHTTGTVRFQNYTNGFLQVDGSGNLFVSSGADATLAQGGPYSVYTSAAALLSSNYVLYNGNNNSGFYQQNEAPYNLNYVSGDNSMPFGYAINDARTGEHSGFVMVPQASNGGNGNMIFYVGNDGANQFQFAPFTWDGANNHIGTPVMTIGAFTGEVGINTTTPAYTLDLNQGTFGFGASNERTEYQNDAGAINGATQSGFFQTSAPSPAADWPTGASSWWHLIDCRHSNASNYYAMQFAGSFFDQNLYFRKLNDSPTTPWERIMTSTDINGTTDYVSKFTSANTIGNSLLYDNGTNVGIGTASPQCILHTSSTGVTKDVDNEYNGNVIIQGTSSGRTAITGAGAQLEFVIPANTDGSNPWGQGRIITVPGSSNSGDATGEMILGSRRSFNKTGAGTAWYYGDDLSINGNGYIGINNTSPNRPLDIGSGTGDGITVGQTQDNTETIQTYIDGQWANRTTYASGCCNLLAIQPDVGQVVIGAMSATAKFEINLSNPLGWSGNLKATRVFAPDNGYYLDMNTYVVAGGNVGYQFSPNGNTGMVITTPGLVGIGTTSPGYTLQVNGNAKVLGNYFYVDYNQNGGSGPPLQTNAGALAISGNWTGGDAEVDFWNVTPNVGSNRGFWFWALTGTNTYGSVAEMNQSGNLTAGSFSTFSDSRLKKDITPLGEDEISNLFKINTYSYKFDKAKMDDAKISCDDLTHFGVLAQELEKLYPELVQTDSRGIKSVNYTELIPVMIELLKNQNEKIQSLQSTADKVIVLEKEIEELKSKK